MTTEERLESLERRMLALEEALASARIEEPEPPINRLEQVHQRFAADVRRGAVEG